ncbi:DNA polymerase III subunit gamma and tau [Janibacter alkaliphilus]|uniref:DNA polymerase III subunit gamma/tau n=1 Tax=Janibacter alkaliphilus TaxID=1069963 RepID=A0A852WZK3_9MICO|nr:DNA polymerase-3 subunit gamma/tau [Janibacter alkaliphilus]
MSTALYRRYRPETFADVIGQEHVTEPLMQALRTGRVNHAYLFSGPRGCGKTTSARILARCLNCEQGPTPEPCGTCDSCVALARSGPGTVDVIEIDAASHGGVDDARDLRERASYGPAQSRYKIYIIDEAHMVTPQGFNALLKIVEEPPEHVKFVFATTEPEKVIGTIRSRTHHYPFRLVPPSRLQDYMEQLCAAEGIEVQPGVLSFVVRSGGGSVRDSLSVLDQLIAGSDERGLTYDRAAALLGFTDGELLDATVTAFAAGDAPGVFDAIDRVVETGLDPRRFVEDLLERFRDLILVAASPEGARAILRALPSDQVDRMRQQASSFGPASLTRAADIVNAGLTEMTGATSPRLQLELIAARVLLPGAAGESGHAARLDRLERRLDVGGVPSGGPQPAPASRQAPTQQPPAQQAPAQPAPAPQPAPRSEPEHSAPASAEPSGTAAQAAGPVGPAAPGPGRDPRPEEPGDAGPGSEHQPAPDGGPSARDQAPDETSSPAAPATAAPAGIDVEALRRSWPDVLGRIYQMRRATWTFLSEHAQVLSFDGQQLTLGIATVGLANAFRNGSHAEVVRQALIDALGVDARVQGIPVDDQPPAAAPARAPRPQPSAGPASETSSGPGAPSGPSPSGSSQSGTAPSGAGRPGSGLGAGPGPDAATALGAGSPAATGSSSGAPRPDWSSTPSDPGSAPAWATAPRGPAEPEQTADAASGPDPTSGPESPVGPSRREQVAAEAGPGAQPSSDDDDQQGTSRDDVDVIEAGEAGEAVVERVLGGTVVEED